MKTFAIGDVHGCFDALLAVVGFAGITEKDRVVWLGDFVDRGPDSAKVLQHLSLLPVENNICLRGNHEIMMQNARRDMHSMRSWASSGGGETWDSYIREYGGDNGIEAVPDEHWEFIEGLHAFFETESHIFVHASIDSELSMSDQFDDVLYWGKFDSIGPHVSGKHVVCGHSSQKDGIPKFRPHATCIDTWACGTGWLTCFDVQTGRYYQANQAGEIRSGWSDQTKWQRDK